MHLTKSDIRAALRHNFLFAELTHNELQHLGLETSVQQLADAAVIVREGEPADALFVVVSGGVNVVKANGQYLAFLGPGGFFGEMGLFIPGASRSASCVATGPTTCILLHRDGLIRHARQQPGVALKVYGAIIRALSERLQATSSDLALLMSHQVRPQPEVTRLVNVARQR